jgi:hypothetical protein
MQKYTLEQLFPDTFICSPTKTGVIHNLRLLPTETADATAVNFEYIGDDTAEGTIPLTGVPAAVAVALKNGRAVELFASVGVIRITGLTEGEEAMLVPRFYQQPQSPKQSNHSRRPQRSTRRRDDGADDETYAIRA